MNNKIKIISILVLFALFLAPIYAAEENAITYIEDDVADVSVEIINDVSPTVFEFPLNLPLGGISGETIEMPGIIEEISEIRDITPPELVIDVKKITTNENNITINGLIESSATLSNVIDEEGIVGFCKFSNSTPISDIDSTPILISQYSEFECKFNIFNLKDGQYNIIFNAKDKIGNTTEKQVALIIDRTAELFVNTNIIFTKEKLITIKGSIDDSTKIISAYVKNIKDEEKINGRCSLISPIIIVPEDLIKISSIGLIETDLSLIDSKPTVSELSQSNFTGFECDFDISELDDSDDYVLVFKTIDTLINETETEINLVVDREAPIVTFTNLTTTDTTPIVSGTVDDLTLVSLDVVINGVTYPNVTVTNGNWNIQVIGALPTGTQNVQVIAKDKTGNITNQTFTNLIINATGGGGTRIYPAPVVPVTPEAPTPEAPTPEPVVQEPQPANENPNGGGQVLTPATPAPIAETPELQEVPVEAPAAASGLTGFAGFASSPGGVVTIVGSILVVIGAVGYFFFLRPR